MAVARLVVVEGPDLGKEYAVPLRGGHIGRDADSVVCLSDPSVSRQHCSLELRDGDLALVDRGSRNRTLVNGAPITAHTLRAGDIVTIGQTRLTFVPTESADVKPTQTTFARPTIEIGSRALLALGRELQEDSALSYLRAIAAIGEQLSRGDDGHSTLEAACGLIAVALEAEHVGIIWRTAGGGLRTRAASSKLALAIELPSGVVSSVLGEGKSVTFDELRIADKAYALAAAPLWAPGGTGAGLLWVAASPGKKWKADDAAATGCLAHLLSAAVTMLDVRSSLEQDNAQLVAQIGGRVFVGTSAGATTVLGFVKKVAPSEATVLLTGESGSGKEMVARAIHENSLRSKNAFVAVNCAALTETLIESELFGHEKGAFTGASERKLGRFELADQGTLFLDEVGELPLGCQTKFLRVLEEQTFERVGGGKSISVDVRVVAATNRDLPAMVKTGAFRDDLYYRLSVIHTAVPPLRDRGDDIPALCAHFLAQLKRQVPRRITGFSQDALATLRSHSWPGNVRELRNAIERAIVLGDGELIEPKDLPPEISNTPIASIVAPAADSPALPLKELERRGIVAALAATGGNKAKAAHLLEIDRSTLYKKLKDYGIEV